MPCRVAVSMRVVNPTEYHDPRDALSQDWFPFLESCGITPILIPNTREGAIPILENLGATGVILTGGNNVCPQTYGVDSKSPMSDTAPERDATEAVLIDWAVAAGLPILGVCRGMHMLNAHFGGTILTDLKSSDVSDHVACEHEVQVTLPRMVESFGCETLATNSYHNQGLTGDELAPVLESWAISDRIIEAVAHRELPVVGIQWHPERPGGSGEFDTALFKSMFVERNFRGM